MGNHPIANRQIFDGDLATGSQDQRRRTVAGRAERDVATREIEELPRVAARIGELQIIGPTAGDDGEQAVAGVKAIAGDHTRHFDRVGRAEAGDGAAEAQRLLQIEDIVPAGEIEGLPGHRTVHDQGRRV